MDTWHCAPITVNTVTNTLDGPHHWKRTSASLPSTNPALLFLPINTASAFFLPVPSLTFVLSLSLISPNIHFLSLFETVEIESEKIKASDVKGNFPHNGYTVYVSGHRILTVDTKSHETVDKWVKEVHKTRRNNRYGTLLVGICLDHFRNYGSIIESIILLCVGSHCLIYHLLRPGDYVPPKSFYYLFADPQVLVAGKDIHSVSKQLQKDYDVNVANPVHLNVLAAKALKRDDLDLPNYNFDRLITTVLGKHMYVVRPANPIAWYEHSFYWWRYSLREEKVKFATADSYLCYLIASELLDLMAGSSCPNDSHPVRKTKAKNEKK